MIILGINAYHPDASAAIICDGELLAAVEEERFNRVKHTTGFPSQAVRYCVETAGIKPGEIDHIAIPRDPRAHIKEKLLYALKMPKFALERLKVLGKFADIKTEVAAALDVAPTDLGTVFHRVEHHQAHLASAFDVSPFDEAALLSVDGLGDFASTMWGSGKGSEMNIEGSVLFPHSLGMLYTAVTQYLGFNRFGDEYKVMGLAAYGEPEYLDQLRDMINVNRSKTELGFKLNLDYFNHHRDGADMTWREGPPAIGKIYSKEMELHWGPARESGEPVEKRHENTAASLQAVLEEVMFDSLNKLSEQSGQKSLCMAGGVALNCVVNGKIFERTPFEQVYIQPAAYDGGLSLGAAYYVYNQTLKQPRDFVMEHAFWGPAYSELRINQALEDSRLKNDVSQIRNLSQDELVKGTAQHIADGKIVGWFQGRTEWGPRALGNRSIIVDPRRRDMKDILNKRIKNREPFRPFAPSILEESVSDYFEESYPSPFMQMTYYVKPEKRSVIPAPTHVDGTGRLQTVNKESASLYWRLIKEFENLTGVPVLLNTSFNDNEPIVCTPEEAIDCFQRTNMDVLVMGNYLVERNGG